MSGKRRDFDAEACELAYRSSRFREDPHHRWCITELLLALSIEGEPNLGELPSFSVPPMQLAMEGMRCYDEWRNTPSKQELKAFKDVPVAAPED